MAENKFLARVKGSTTTKSLVEIQNDKLVQPFMNMPTGTDDSTVGLIDDKDSSVVVAKGAENWKVNGSNLVPTNSISGDGGDFTADRAVSGQTLWINAEYTYPASTDPNNQVVAIFNTGTKWVLKLVGHDLLTDNGDSISASIVIKVGSTAIATKSVQLREQAGYFCEKIILDFAETNANAVRVSGGQKLTLQLLCGDSTASASLFDGQTILTALERRVDANVVSGDTFQVSDLVGSQLIAPNYFSDGRYIDQAVDGEQNVALFTRNGTEMALSGWQDPNALVITDYTGD